MRWLKICAYTLLTLVVVVGILSWWFIFRGLPSVDELRAGEPTRLSRLIASDGTVIASYPPEGRIVLSSRDIPTYMSQAFVAAEDATFYQHAGIDVRRIFSALITDIRAASYVQGASTITQQVVRTYLLSRKKTITRKVREAVLALRIEKALSKEEILTLYLDRIYLGSGAYGVGAASQRYFGRDLKELDLAEMAMIAGLAPAPARYSPLNDFDAAKRRQRYVLSRMAQEGFISETEAEDAYAEPLRITGKKVARFTSFPYVADFAKGILKDRYGEELFSKGLSVQTTIVPRLQESAVLAVRKGALNHDMRQGEYRGPERNMGERSKTRILSFQKNQLTWQGMEFYRLYWAEVNAVEPFTVNMGLESKELAPESYSWITPKGSFNPAEVFQPGDMVQLCRTNQGLRLCQEPRVQAALVAFDVNTGGVVALVGGVDYAKSQFNRAVNARRQSGSAIKPFIYAAAIDKGYTPATIIFDTPITYRSEEDEEAWRPKNYSDKFYGPTTLRTGLEFSRNVVTVKILKDVGLSDTLSFLKHFDLGDEMPRDLSLALGSGAITPYDLTRAYAYFAAYGKRFSPHLMEYINQEDVGPIFTARPEEPQQVISEQTAYITTNILTGVVNNGTGWRARSLKRPVAAKTGTSNDNRDAWFMGYSPDIVCGVWVGYDDMVPLGENETGSRAAGPVFTDFMRAAHKDRPVHDFPVPEGIVFAKVDTRTGKLAAENSRHVRFECFREGNLPPREEAVSNQQLLKDVF